jgi:uncharacterized damage-inducible protein DinB
MNAIELITRLLVGSGETLKMTLADFTDAEMLQRPCPGANHPLWQLGHLCVAETNIGNMIKPGSMPELPAGLAGRFENKKTNHVDDPQQLAGKAQLLEVFTKARQATIASLKTFSEADLDAPGPERIRRLAATVGEAFALNAQHVMMHVGQMQAARRKLAKPILF